MKITNNVRALASKGMREKEVSRVTLRMIAALRKDLPAIAFEAGTSVAKLNTNYVEAATEDDAREFFSLIPGELGK